MDDEKTLLRKVADTIEEKSITFDIDVPGLFGKKKKRSFEVKPLTLSQLQRISKLLLDIDGKVVTANDIFILLRDHAWTCAEIVAIAVTESRRHPSKRLINLFFNNLDHGDMDTALNIVFKQMEVINFTNTIISIKTLNVLERKPAGVQSAKKGEVSPQVPGDLSETA
jgi:hypothetical protein